MFQNFHKYKITTLEVQPVHIDVEFYNTLLALIT